MIVERFTYQIKPGYMEKALALVQEERDHSPHRERIRFYRTMFGTLGQLMLEFEFDDLAQHAEHWDAWVNSERSAPFSEKWHDVIESNGHREIWQVA